MSLSFIPTYRSCTFRTGESPEQDDGIGMDTTSISWTCALDFEDKVRLATGESLQRGLQSRENDISGYVHMSTQPRELRRKSVLGVLAYLKPAEGTNWGLPARPALFSLEIQVKPELFEKLLGLAAQKQLPEVSVNIPSSENGLKMGWEPDGSGREWNNKEHQLLEVNAFKLSFPFIQEKEEAEAAPPSPDPLTPIYGVLASIKLNQTWMLLGILALCVLTWLKR
jgi:hypothetical protein